MFPGVGLEPAATVLPLMSLGEVDYGLHGLVAGLTVFISFFNDVLGTSLGRFYALAVGRARVMGDDGLEECRHWFSLAVIIHTILPVCLFVVGWPIGEWVIRHYLTIPPDRMAACLWVFRFSCVGCFIGMVSVPFGAMYGAKQYIAELTVYGFVCTTLNIIVLGYMVTHPGDWLVKYAFWLRMMVDAPRGWGGYSPGAAYVDWYQPLNIFALTPTLINDHLTRLVAFSWAGRFAYLWCGLRACEGKSRMGGWQHIHIR